MRDQEQGLPLTALPTFCYAGVVLDSAGLRYRPHPDVIHPSVIDAGVLGEGAPGRYLMYYAPHDAPGGICLASAENPEGPWREYERNPVVAREAVPGEGVSHVSSPHAIWNPEAGRLFLYFHGNNDVTRYALSADGIHFDYGGVAVTTRDFEPGLREASYARVFRLAEGGERGPYVMLVMGNHRGTRKVYRAWSRDGRQWEACPEAFLTPPPGTSQMGPGWPWTWQGRSYLVAYANRADAPEYDPVSDLYLYEVAPDWGAATCLGLFMDHTVAGPDNRRINDPCLVETPGRLYLFVNVGRRLNQRIALAVAEVAAGA